MKQHLDFAHSTSSYCNELHVLEINGSILLLVIVKVKQTLSTKSVIFFSFNFCIC